jgi:prepilin-type N-terminal cleavage/methylation domain-containing protein
MTSAPAPTTDHRQHPYGRDDGFTLVEIVIAIVLVGILSAVAVVGIGALTDKGSTAACSASLDAAKAGSVVYLASNAAYPTTIQQMTTSSPPAYSLPSGVTLDGTGTVATGQGWTLTISPGTTGGPPVFSCSGGAGSGTTATGTTACPGTYADWVGEYYTGVNPTGTPALCRNDTALNFNWAGAGPGNGVPADNFSARWTRTVTFTAGSHNFTVGSDDGSRLLIDGTALINYWSDHGYGTMSAATTLTAGPHTVVLEYYERGGSAQATLAWT